MRSSGDAVLRNERVGPETVEFRLLHEQLCLQRTVAPILSRTSHSGKPKATV